MVRNHIVPISITIVRGLMLKIIIIYSCILSFYIEILQSTILQF